VKRVAPIAVLLLAVALALAATAVAERTIYVPSRITIENHHGVHFMGEVHADTYEPCEQNRRVRLFKVIKNGPDQVVGRDTTNNRGEWSIMPQGSAGISFARFYAKVKRSSQGAAGTIYVCQADRSPTLKAGS
jgi:hypothetical protein